MIGSLVSAGVGLLGGLLGGRPTTATNTQTYERQLTPDQVEARDNFLAGALDMVRSPGAGLTPMRNQALQDVNRQYAGTVPRLQSTAALRGFGDSGKLFEGLLSLDTARSGDLARTGNQFSQYEIDQRNRGMQMLMQLLSMNNKSTSTSTARGPGNMLAAAMAGLAGSRGFGDLTRGGPSMGSFMRPGDFGEET